MHEPRTKFAYQFIHSASAILNEQIATCRACNNTIQMHESRTQQPHTLQSYRIGGPERANNYMSSMQQRQFKCINRERQTRTNFIHTASVAPNVQIAICRVYMQQRHFKCMNHERQNLCTIYPYSIGGSERANNHVPTMQQRHFKCMKHNSIIPHRWHRTCK